MMFYHFLVMASALVWSSSDDKSAQLKENSLLLSLEWASKHFFV
jgi:hypothetical protein